ncbi:hypothetical protein GJ496_000595 [Pomphorhynchus laevis]|nr:hypothetical protein GJ496_000595 [Pomphorhynchus laevis]
MANSTDDDEIVSREMIDKYAQFVARNGPQFEQMTLTKQYNNPRFAFIHPNGPMNDYYQNQLMLERQKYMPTNRTVPSYMSSRLNIPAASGIQPAATRMTHGYYNEGSGMYINDFYEGSDHVPYGCPDPPSGSLIPSQMMQPPVRNSMYWRSAECSMADYDEPSNPRMYTPNEISHPPPPLILLRLLSGIRDVSTPYFKHRAIRACSCIKNRLHRIAVQLKIDRTSLDNVVYKAMESCTKDNISNARSVIVDKLIDSSAHANFVVCLFMEKILITPIMDESSVTSTDNAAQLRLHSIYLLNDVLSHASKDGKKLEILQQELESALPLLFAGAAFKITENGLPCELEQIDIERCSKLIKLLDLWKKNEYFSNPDNLVELAEGIACLSSDINGDEYQESSNRLAHYADSYIDKEFKPELDRFEARNSQYGYNQIPPDPMPVYLHNNSSNNYLQRPYFSQPPYRANSFDYHHHRSNPPPRYAPLLATPPPPAFDPSQPPPGFGPTYRYPNPLPLTSGFHRPRYPIGTIPRERHQIASNVEQANIIPPFVDPPVFTEECSEPQYYDLPAGLMCLHIGPSDCDYDPLDPKLIRPLSPPTDKEIVKINAALDRFYEESRTKDGWEPSGLFEFYKQKFTKKVAKRKELYEKRVKRRETSRSLSRSRSCSSSCSSRSQSSDRTSDDGNMRSSNRSFSPDHTTVRRKLTSAPEVIPDQNLVVSAEHTKSRPLDQTNKGHQLLQKMGWSGAGLGKQEQGIVEPINQGEIRDKSDKYKGVGVDHDVFDEFRKSRSKKYSRSWIEKR